MLKKKNNIQANKLKIYLNYMKFSKRIQIKKVFNLKKNFRNQNIKFKKRT